LGGIRNGDGYIDMFRFRLCQNDGLQMMFLVGSK
jgi:hypothetical protein